MSNIGPKASSSHSPKQSPSTHGVKTVFLVAIIRSPKGGRFGGEREWWAPSHFWGMSWGSPVLPHMLHPRCPPGKLEVGHQGVSPTLWPT